MQRKLGSCLSLLRFLEGLLHLWLVQHRLVAKLNDVLLVWMGKTLEGCEENVSIERNPGKNAKFSLFNRANRGSCKRFLGNMPLTARRRTSPPPHLANISSIVMLFKLPGRVLWE